MISILEKSQLFKSISRDEIASIVDKYGKILEYESGEFIFSKGDKPEYMYILLEGSLQVFSEDINGKKELLSSFSRPGSLFAEVYLYLEKGIFHFYAQTESKTTLLGINKDFFKGLLGANSPSGQIIVENYLNILSQKLFYFNQKIRIMSGFSLRQKLARFIIENSNDKSIFESEYNREEIADYLGATRPSVSRELGRMQSEGLIEVDRSTFKILDLEQLYFYY